MFPRSGCRSCPQSKLCSAGVGRLRKPITLTQLWLVRNGELRGNQDWKKTAFGASVPFLGLFASVLRGPEGCIDLGGRVLLHSRQYMAVEVERDPDFAVT